MVFLGEKKFFLKKNIPLFLVSVFLICLGFISNDLNNSYLIIVSFLLATIVSFFLSSEDRFYLLCILLVSNRVLTLNSISILSLIIVIDCFVRLLKNKLNVTKNFMLLSIILIIIVMFSSNFNVGALLSILKIFLMLIFFYNVFLDYDVKKIYKNSVDFISIGTIFAFLISFLINKDLFINSTRFSLTGGGGENILGIICAIITIHNVSIIVSSKISFIKVIEVISLSFIGVVTGSRSFLLALFIGIVIISIAELRKKSLKAQIKYYVFIIILIIVFLIVVKNFSVLNNFYNSLIHRINKLNSNDISNGRFELWYNYINVFKNDYKILLFGSVDYSKFGITMVAHNMILEQIASYGIVGCIILFLQYFNVFSSIIKAKKIKFSPLNASVAPLTAFIIISMASHSLLGIPQTLLLFLSLIACCINKEKEVKI